MCCSSSSLCSFHHFIFRPKMPWRSIRTFDYYSIHLPSRRHFQRNQTHLHKWRKWLHIFIWLADSSRLSTNQNYWVHCKVHILIFIPNPCIHFTIISRKLKAKWKKSFFHMPAFEKKNFINITITKNKYIECLEVHRGNKVLFPNPEYSASLEKTLTCLPSRSTTRTSMRLLWVIPGTNPTT